MRNAFHKGQIFVIKITGLDQLSRTIEDAQKAMSELDGELGSVSFDPQDPASIEAAIKAAEQLIEERVGRYSANSIVGPMIGELKEKYREAILEKAAGARLVADPE
jgi:hypothetical protein